MWHKKFFSDTIEDSIKKNRQENRFRGGLIIEKSNCCDAPIIHTHGGLKIPMCKKCKKEVRPIVFK
jgi:hypothetical protein